MNVRLLLLVAGLCAAGAVHAGDPAAGKFKFSTCSGCHGVPGYTNVYPSYHVPKLGGQHADYIIAALGEYRAGKRQHPTMTANASVLGEADIADIAAYLSGIAPAAGQTPARGDPAAGKQKAAVCAACHGADGQAPSPAFPRLAGQHADYLVHALQAYKDGTRQNPIMQGMAANLSAQDQLDLAAWFTSQPQGLAVPR